MARMRQTLSLTVTTKGDKWPSHYVGKALYGQDHITDFQISLAGPAVSLPAPNRDRLIALAVWAAGEHAKKELGLPSEWDQRDWLVRSDCGTACCIAGKVALDDGGVPVARSQDGTWTDDWAAVRVDQVTSRVKFPDQNEAVSVQEYAQKALGLTETQAHRLFAGQNDLRATLAVIRGILAEAAEPTSARARRRRSDVTVAYGHGPDCDICYEDVPDSESAEEA